MKLILGVDGGGTKSHLALFTDAGACAGAAAAGPLNHECMAGSYSEFEAALPAFIDSVLDSANACIDDVEYAVFGISGTDTAAQHDRASELLRKIGFRRFTLCNDAFLGVPAGCPDGAGICCINGTGSSMAAIDYSGATVQVAGVGDITADLGGGGWYAMQAISAVYSELYKLGEPTIMREGLFALAGVTLKEDYVDAIAGQIADKTLDIRAAACILFDAAEAGDNAALEILDRSATHYAGGVSYLAGSLDFPADRTLHISLVGSVFTKQKVRVLPDMIECKTRGKLGCRPMEFRNLEAPPVAGAVLWAAKKAAFDIEMAKIREELTAAGL